MNSTVPTASQQLRVGDMVAIRGDLRTKVDGTCQYLPEQLVDGKYLKHTGHGGVWRAPVEKVDGDMAKVGGGWRRVDTYEVMDAATAERLGGASERPAARSLGQGDVARVIPDDIASFKARMGVDVGAVTNRVLYELYGALQVPAKPDEPFLSMVAKSGLARLKPAHAEMLGALASGDHADLVTRMVVAACAAHPTFEVSIQGKDGESRLQEVVMHWTVCEIARQFPQQLRDLPIALRLGPDPAFGGVLDKPLASVAANCTWGHQMGVQWQDAHGSNHVVLYVGDLTRDSYEVSVAVGDLAGLHPPGVITMVSGKPQQVEPRVASSLLQLMQDHRFLPTSQTPAAMFSHPANTSFEDIYAWLEQAGGVQRPASPAKEGRVAAAGMEP